MVESEVIREYEKQITKLETDMQILRITMSSTQKELNAKMARLKELRAKIHEMKVNNKEITVTDHAIVRYLERVEGIDIDAVIEKIASEEVVKQIETLGSDGIYVADNCKVVCKDNTIITIMT